MIFRWCLFTSIFLPCVNCRDHYSTDDRADALHQGASQFETQAAKLKNKFWLENMKYMIALGIVVVIVIAVAVCKSKHCLNFSGSFFRVIFQG